MVKEQNWTKIITAKKSWWDVDLKGVFEYRDLIGVFVKRDIVSIYKQTVLGPVWFLFGPLFTVFTYTFAFSTIAQIPTDGIPAPVFYLAGTTLWNYFQSCFNGVSSTFRGNANIFGKVYFPRLVTPISMMISNLMKLGIQLVVFILFCIYYSFQGKVDVSLNVLFFPVVIIVLGGIAMGLGLIVSSVTTKYRDVSQLLGVFMMLLMYASPIIYPSSSVPEMLKPYLMYNPISPLIDFFRFSFTGAGGYSIYGLLYSFCFAIVVLFFGVLLFSRAEKDFMDTV